MKLHLRSGRCKENKESHCHLFGIFDFVWELIIRDCLHDNNKYFFSKADYDVTNYTLWSINLNIL